MMLRDTCAPADCCVVGFAMVLSPACALQQDNAAQQEGPVPAPQNKEGDNAVGEPAAGWHVAPRLQYERPTL
jgi:hypothetical protein